MDYALLTVGSAFTMGVSRERNTALIRVMAAVPEHAHKMAATAEIDCKMADTTAPVLPILLLLNQANMLLIIMSQAKSQLIVVNPVKSVLQYPSLASSVRDAPLVSARTAGIPKPTHFSHPVPELIPCVKYFP